MFDQNHLKSEAGSDQVFQQIIHNLIEISEEHPKFPICQHLAAILRRKSTEGDVFFHWKDSELLKRIEDYRKEVSSEQLLNIGQD